MPLPKFFQLNLLDFILLEANIDFGAQRYDVVFSYLPDETFVVFEVEISQRNLNKPTFISRGVVAVVEASGSTTINIFFEVVRKYKYFSENFNSRVYVRAINKSGMQSPIQYVDGNNE